MNILAPVNTFESAKAYINSGAEEIYLGADDEVFSTLSFTGRGKYSYTGQPILSKFEEVKQIVMYAHNKGVKVNFLCNFPMFSNGEYKGRNLEDYFLDYIERGISIGIDALVIGDVGILKAVSERSYPVEIHASVYFKTINKQQLLFLKSLGVNRTVLSYHITMDEIKDLVQANIMDLEIIGYLGCSFFNGACNFLHDYGEGVRDEFDPGISCKGLYEVSDGFKTGVSKLFDAEAGCALCKLGELDQLGVKALKIVGRERNFEYTNKVIQLYCEFLNYYRQGKSQSDLDAIIPPWWRKLWCSNRRCKYDMKNSNYQYIIGGRF